MSRFKSVAATIVAVIVALALCFLIMRAICGL